MTDNPTVMSVLQQLEDRIDTFAGRPKPENLLTPGSVFTSRSLRHDGGVGGQDLLLDQPLQTV